MTLDGKRASRIGTGFIYVAYRKGDGRVYKRVRSAFSALCSIVFANIRYGGGIKGTIEDFRVRQERTRGLREHHERLCAKKIPAKLFGNIEFESDGVSYSQDLCEPLGKCLLAHPDAVRERLVAYTHLQRHLWSYGVHDAEWDFLHDCGIAPNGSLVIFGLNKLSFEPGILDRDLAGRAWESCNSYRRMPTEWRKVVDEVFRRAFEGLDAYEVWMSASSWAQ